jgi:hypothetical protein
MASTRILAVEVVMFGTVQLTEVAAVEVATVV